MLALGSSCVQLLLSKTVLPQAAAHSLALFRFLLKGVLFMKHILGRAFNSKGKDLGPTLHS